MINERSVFGHHVSLLFSGLRLLDDYVLENQTFMLYAINQ